MVEIKKKKLISTQTNSYTFVTVYLTVDFLSLMDLRKTKH